MEVKEKYCHLCCNGMGRSKRKPFGCFNLIKNTNSSLANGTFTFTLTSPGRTPVVFTITTVGGQGIRQVCLPLGTWTITESPKTGWSIANPQTVTIVKGNGNADVTMLNSENS